MLAKSLFSGLVGAVVLTTLHESARRVVPHAPRLDVLGRRAIAKSASAAGISIPDGDNLQNTALAGDLVSNALYYGLIGLGSARAAIANGGALGCLAGIGAVLLPKRIGLGEQPTNRTRQTQAMTIAWYTIGGLAAGLCHQACASTESHR